MAHHRGETRAAVIEAGFLHRRRASHLAQQLGSLELVRRERDAHVAVRNEALVVSVSIDYLSDVLRDQVGLQAITRHVRQGISEDFHAIEGWEFIDKKKETVLVALLFGALENHLLREPIDGHGKYQPDQ